MFAWHPHSNTSVSIIVSFSAEVNGDIPCIYIIYNYVYTYATCQSLLCWHKDGTRANPFAVAMIQGQVITGCILKMFHILRQFDHWVGIDRHQYL